VTKIFSYQEFPWGTSEVEAGNPLSAGSIQLDRALMFLKTVRGKVLDVGCGAGNFTRGIKSARKDLQLYGIDVGREAIRIARKRSKNINYKAASAYKLPFKSLFFEGVVMFDVLEHIDYPDRAVSEVRRVLKKGGKCFLAVPLEASLWTAHGILFKIFGIKVKEKTYGHVQQFSQKDLVKLLKRHGFDVVSVSYGDYFLFQAVDVLYQLYLKLSGKRVQELGYTLRKRSAIPKTIISLIFFIFVALTFFETKVFSGWLPGMDAHIGAIKSNGKFKK